MIPRISEKNCVNCDKYLGCKDPLRSIVYVCSRYRKSDGKNELALFADVGIELVGRRYVPTLSQEDLISEFDAHNAILNVIKDKKIVSPDLKIPEGDFEKAPNFYTWASSKRFTLEKPFLEQAVMGTRLFAEWCPRCSDTDWLLHDHKVTDSLSKFERRVALLEHGVCPHCKRTRKRLVDKKVLPYYIELACCCGQRSGKSAFLGMASSYLTHLQLKLERPNEVYKLLSSNVLQGTFVALTFAQAKDTLWEPFYGTVLDSPWFQQYHAMLQQYEARTGEDLLKLNDTFLLYKHRRVYVYPAGPDKRVLRGRTRFMAAIDELGWLPNDVASQKNVKMNAHEIYTALENSLATVAQAANLLFKSGHFDVPPSYFMNISSPSSIRDKIMELVRQSMHSPHILGVQKPTWEMNPTLPQGCPFLEKKFRADPVAAMRDFGAQPPITNNAFISNQDHVAQCLTGKKNPVKLHYKVTKPKNKGSISEIYATIASIKESGRPSVMALDGGYSNNSFGVAIGHLEKDLTPVISLVAEIIPLPGTPINYSRAYRELLIPLIAHRNVVLSIADRWNSLKILSDMEADLGLSKKQHSLTYQEMLLFKDYLADGKLVLPRTSATVEEILNYDHSNYPHCFKHKPEEHLVLQALTVQDTGNAVIKGDNLTDDIFRAAMLCFTFLVDEFYREDLLASAKEITKAVDVSQMAVARSYSGGSSNRSGSSGGAQSSIGVLVSRT